MARTRPTLAELESSAARPSQSWTAHAAVHDALLLARAYPASSEMHGAAGELARTHASRVRELSATERARGDDSGIEGTVSRHTYDLGTAEWLVGRYEKDVEIDWKDARAGEALQSLLGPFVFRAEEDGLDAESISMRHWVRTARGTAWPSDLAWLLHVLRHTGDALPRRVRAWDEASVPIRWLLRSAGVAHATLPQRAYTPRPEMRTPPAQVVRAINTPLRGIRLLRGAAAQTAIAVARETLATRCREVHAISFANPDEVWHADLGAGTAVVLYGVTPELRLSLEANYGYVLFANGVPVGYGGVSPLFRQANTGINIFEPFRGTEAACLWVRALQAFRTLFGVGRFVVSPYQIGGGNSEAIDSGAFWFYYRLGFRPATAALRALAAEEAARRKRNPRHRSAKDVLRVLARAELHLTLPSFARADAFDEARIPQVALRATARIASLGAVDRRAALQRIATRVARRLGTSVPRGTAEREAWMQFAALVGTVPDLERWTAPERRRLAKLVSAKCAPREREFAVLATRSTAFFTALSDSAP
jgi:hypothetical protein